ncbi:MAG: LptF/LptG family permease [Verrucomicrobia bacterium]|nr:LptF/LptG family permease [Verrucomicrobiota bacterium]
MRLLDRYLLRELLFALGYCLGGFLIFWISFDLLSELDDYQQRGLSAREIAALCLAKTPALLVVAMPIALLLALLYSLTNHARHQEIIAMRVAGVSLWRLAAPYFFIGLAFTFTLFVLNELWVPQTVETVESILHRPSSPPQASEEGRWHENVNFNNARDGRIWNIGAFNLDTFEMKRPHVSWLSSDANRHTLIAHRAVRTNACWVFYEVVEFTHPATSETDATRSKTNLLAVPEFSETPEQIKSEIRINRLRNLNAPKEAELSLSEILGYLRLHPNPTRTDYALLHTQLHGRLAWPWTCVVVVLIALPFGAASARRNIFVGVASSIFICFVFFVLLRLGLALGTSGRIAPWFAAWLPNLGFGAMGLWLTARMR